MSSNEIVVEVEFNGVLKSYVKSDRITIKLPINSTVRDLLLKLREVSESLFKRVYDSDLNDLQPDIYIAINDVDIRLRNYLNTKLNNGDRVLILAYIHGG